MKNHSFPVEQEVRRRRRQKIQKKSICVCEDVGEFSQPLYIASRCDFRYFHLFKEIYRKIERPTLRCKDAATANRRFGKANNRDLELSLNTEHGFVIILQVNVEGSKRYLLMLKCFLQPQTVSIKKDFHFHVEQSAFRLFVPWNFGEAYEKFKKNLDGFSGINIQLCCVHALNSAKWNFIIDREVLDLRVSRTECD